MINEFTMIGKSPDAYIIEPAKKKRKKQKAESIFRDCLNWLKNEKMPHLWFIKLQVNPMAHTVSPCDYLVLDLNDRHAIEVKEITLDHDGKGVFAFDRLTQKGSLKEFQDSNMAGYNKSWVFLYFRGSTITNGFAFLFSLEEYSSMEQWTQKKSVTLEELQKYHSANALKYLRNGVFDISRFTMGY